MKHHETCVFPLWFWVVSLQWNTDSWFCAHFFWPTCCGWQSRHSSCVLAESHVVILIILLDGQTDQITTTIDQLQQIHFPKIFPLPFPSPLGTWITWCRRPRHRTTFASRVWPRWRNSRGSCPRSCWRHRVDTYLGRWGEKRWEPKRQYYIYIYIHIMGVFNEINSGCIQWDV